MTTIQKPKGLYILGTGTDVGKTYITALWLKRLREAGHDVAYYKAAVSGAPSITESDAGYVKQVAGLSQADDTLLSYVFDEAVSPHLAARHEGKVIDRTVVNKNFCHVARAHAYTTVEGSGGIICPLHVTDTELYMLEDVVKDLNLPTIIVATAALGTINSTVLTIHYLQSKGIPVKGIIVNHYTGNPMEEDNCVMIERLTGIPVLDRVGPGETSLHMDVDAMLSCYEEIVNPQA
ncbi:dethiobiotin synthase [Veillonella sp. CHU110]|uniref:dethiobiotin synthase n=1 Tax=Veillonella sp. CHU110 TaxID=2490947 RepID=UPI000F8F05DF|nr:dethiobiotin synthase [Veillonella sp. CHU110]